MKALKYKICLDVFFQVYPSSNRQAAANRLVPDIDEFATSAAPSCVQSSNEEALAAKKIAYPKSVFFIFVTECAERFSFYGMRSKLAFNNDMLT